MKVSEVTESMAVGNSNSKPFESFHFLPSAGVLLSDPSLALPEGLVLAGLHAVLIGGAVVPPGDVLVRGNLRKPVARVLLVVDGDAAFRVLEALLASAGVEVAPAEDARVNHLLGSQVGAKGGVVLEDDAALRVPRDLRVVCRG